MINSKIDTSFWTEYAKRNYTDYLGGAIANKAPVNVEYDEGNGPKNSDSIFGMDEYKALVYLYGMHDDSGVSNCINIYAGTSSYVDSILASIGVDFKLLTTGTTERNLRYRLESCHHNFIKESAVDSLFDKESVNKVLSYVKSVNIKQVKKLNIDIPEYEKIGQWAIIRGDHEGEYSSINQNKINDMLLGLVSAADFNKTDSHKTILINMPFTRNVGVLAEAGVKFSIHLNNKTARVRAKLPDSSGYASWQELLDNHTISSKEDFLRGVKIGSVVYSTGTSLTAVAKNSEIIRTAAEGKYNIIDDDTLGIYVGYDEGLEYVNNYDDYEAFVYKGKMVGTRKYILDNIGKSNSVIQALRESSKQVLKPNIFSIGDGKANFRPSRTMAFYDVADVLEKAGSLDTAGKIDEKICNYDSLSAKETVAAVIGERLANEIVISELPKKYEGMLHKIAHSNDKITWQCGKGHKWEATVGNRVHGTNCPVCHGSMALAGETDLATLHPDVASEWDYDKNGELKPTQVRPGSSKKVWWICNKAGHSWDALIAKRALGSQGCPICSNRRIVAGINDLATTNPDLAKQYSPGNRLKATEVSGRSSRKAIWECEYGHKWEASILKRANGQQCPQCRKEGRIQRAKKSKVFLNTLNPLTMDEWDYENNPDDKNPSNIPAHSRKKYSWIGKDCAHVWEATATSRASGSNCPICAGKVVDGTTSLAAKNPELVRQWSAKNDVKPNMVHAGSRSSAWWICDEGHEWKAEINSRAKGTGCPVCTGRIVKEGFNDLATLNPSLADEWDYDSNGDIKPSEVSLNSHTPFWWQCNKDTGHKWQAAPKTRNGSSVGCPYCSSGPAGAGVSVGENEVYAEVVKLRPDAEQSNRSVLGRQEIDIWIPKLMLGFEYNGNHWHDETHELRGEAIRDRHARKRARAEELGITLVDIPETAWLQNRDAAMEQIREEISKAEASVSPGQ